MFALEQRLRTVLIPHTAVHIISYVASDTYHPEFANPVRSESPVSLFLVCSISLLQMVFQTTAQSIAKFSENDTLCIILVWFQYLSTCCIKPFQSLDQRSLRPNLLPTKHDLLPFIVLFQTSAVS